MAPGWARSLYAASDWVATGREETNRIKVFPIPDRDAGTNFNMTLLTVVATLQETARTPTVSQPEFAPAFRDVRNEADGVVAVFLSSGQSGTFPRS